MIAERTTELATFFAETFGRDSDAKPVQTGSGSPDLSDEEIIVRARDAGNGAKFRTLWAGDTSAYGGDDSAADLALLSVLTFWTQNANQLDRLFRRSGLYREKWERTDYRLRTITRALQRDDVYEPIARPNPPGRNGTHAQADVGSEVRPLSASEVQQAFCKWLYLPDPGLVYVLLAAVAANLLESDPVWLLIVGASSGGKTEIINAIARALSYVYLAATLTEAALLSGTPQRDKAQGARGGLLRVIGDFGVLALKDFTSVLSMNRDVRAQLLAALREIFDGSWTRYVGVDGGKTLAWSGKLGLIAGCTAAIDSHHAVMSVMGERFLIYRLPTIEPGLQAERALENAGKERAMRDELAAAVSGLFAGLDIGKGLPPIDAWEKSALVALSSLVASARSAVERDPYKREIELVLDTEAPARLAQTLRRLYAGLIAIGLDRGTAWPLVRKTGLDSIPKLRRAVFDILLDATDWETTTTIATSAHYPTTTARRALEDLAAHGVVDRQAGGPGKADRWRLSAVTRDRYTASVPEKSGVVQLSVPEKSEGFFQNPNRTCTDILGTPQNSASPCGESGQTRVRQCWACKAMFEGDRACEQCGWQVCPCGACSPDCDYQYAFDGAES